MPAQEIDRGRSSPQKTQRQAAVHTSQRVAKVIAMQDSSEKTIPVVGEGREEMIREREEREEGGDWEPNSEDIDGFDDEHNDVTP